MSSCFFSFANPLDVLLALAGSVIWAVYWIYNVKLEGDEVIRFFLNFASTAIGLVLIAAGKVLQETQ